MRFCFYGATGTTGTELFNSVSLLAQCFFVLYQFLLVFFQVTAMALGAFAEVNEFGLVHRRGFRVRKEGV